LPSIAVDYLRLSLTAVDYLRLSLTAVDCR